MEFDGNFDYGFKGMALMTVLTVSRTSMARQISEDKYLEGAEACAGGRKYSAYFNWFKEEQIQME